MMQSLDGVRVPELRAMLAQAGIDSRYMLERSEMVAALGQARPDDAALAWRLQFEEAGVRAQSAVLAPVDALLDLAVDFLGLPPAPARSRLGSELHAASARGTPGANAARFARSGLRPRGDGGLLGELFGQLRQSPGADSQEELVEPPAPPAAIGALPQGCGGATCAVCLEDAAAEDAAKLPCGHEFHRACIDQWLRRSGVCPVCRHVV